MIKMKQVSYQMRNKDLETENEVRKMKRLSFGCLGVREERSYEERLKENGSEIARHEFIETS